MNHHTRGRQTPNDGNAQGIVLKRFKSVQSDGGRFIGVLRMLQPQSVRTLTNGNLWDRGTSNLTCSDLPPSRPLGYWGHDTGLPQGIEHESPITLGLNTDVNGSVEIANDWNDLLHLPERRGIITESDSIRIRFRFS